MKLEAPMTRHFLVKPFSFPSARPLQALQIGLDDGLSELNVARRRMADQLIQVLGRHSVGGSDTTNVLVGKSRSEEHTSELQSP